MIRGVVAVLLSGAAAYAQDRSDWQSLSGLKPGDRVLVSLKAHGSKNGTFQAWTPGQITVDSETILRPDVDKVRRYRNGVWGHGKTALVGAAIGGGAGLGIGAGLGGNCGHSLGPCASRGEAGGMFAGVGALVGAGIGALIPHHRLDLIYASK